MGLVAGDGMERIFDQLYDGYGNRIDNGKGPGQGAIGRRGVAGLKKEYPKLDLLLNCTI